MLLLKTEIPVTNGQRDRLVKAIEDIRNEWEYDEWDTDSVVHEVFTRVFGTDVEVERLFQILKLNFR